MLADLPEPTLENPAPLAFMLAYVGDEIGGAIETAVERSGLTFAQAKFLRHLVRHADGVPLAELAERSRTSRPNVSQMLDRLDSAGVTERHRNPGDARSTVATVTPLGLREYAAAEQAARAFELRLRARLGDDRARELWSAIIDSLDQR